MIKKITFFLLTLTACSSMLFAESYLTNVTTEPEHANLNYDGELEFLYDLPKVSLVKKAYLETEINGITSTFDSTVTDSGFTSINNSIKLSGEELYTLIKNRNSLEESDDRSPADGTYSIRLRIELDTSSNSSSSSSNDDDDETNDDDDSSSSSSTIPAYAEKTIKVTFDNKAPKAPSAIEIEGGNEEMVIKVTPPSTADGKYKEKIGMYHAKVSGTFMKNGSETETTLEYDSEVSSDSYNKVWEFKIKGKDDYEFINNDSGDSDKAYTIEVYAEDLAGNKDESASISVEASAVTTYGFWSNYQSKGGKDDGGFCFVATAGFGSYFHPSVELLREFRDHVLAKFELGKAFIAAYYKYGSYPAEVIKDSSFLRASSRTALTPLVIAAWFLTTVIGRCLLLACFIMVTILVFRSKKSKKKVLLGLGLLFFLAIPEQAVEAAEVHGEFGLTNLLYYPENIDSEASDAFKEVGGEDIRYMPSFDIGLAATTKYIRLSFIGSIGITRFKGKAVKTDGSKGADRSTFRIIPLSAVIKLRPVYDFPVYPYVEGGIDYYAWWVRDLGKTTENGGTFGLHGTFGLLFSLNWIDNSAATKMAESGIYDTMLFLGYRLEKINDFWQDDSWDLSNKKKYNFEFGILFEF